MATFPADDQNDQQSSLNDDDKDEIINTPHVLAAAHAWAASSVSSTSITAPNIAAPPSPALERVYGRVMGHLERTSLEYYGRPVEGLSKSETHQSAVHTLRQFAAALSERGDLVPHNIRVTAAEAFVRTDGWIPDGSSASQDAAAAVFAQLFDDVLPLLESPAFDNFPWPEAEEWRFATGWLFEWASSLDAFVCRVRTEVSRVLTHTHHWKRGTMALPCLHDVPAPPPYLAGIPSSGSPKRESMCQPPVDGLLSQSSINIGVNIPIEAAEETRIKFGSHLTVCLTRCFNTSN